MSKKLLLILFTFHFSLFILKAQDIKRTWHWNFGSHEGLDFSSGSPVPIYNSSIGSWNGCSSISDTNGNLLCYVGDSVPGTNYQNIWNRNNTVMPNGHTLLAYPETWDDLIVPEPLNDSILYVFYGGGYSLIKYTCYAIVNMDLDGGLGDVTKKNVPFFANSYGYSAYTTECATQCANDTDIWILTARAYTDSFFVFRLTPHGLDTVPVISACGLDSISDVGSDIKFSPSGTKLAIIGAGNAYYTELLNFNDTTGVVYSSNPIVFSDSSAPHLQNAQGIEFSPDESKLYWSLFTVYKYLYQANLDAGSVSAIEHSVVLIDSIYTPNRQGLGSLQLAPDGKIYLSKVEDYYLGAINYPNNLGAVCDYVDSAVDLPNYSFGDTACFYGLPNFVSTDLYETKYITGGNNSIYSNTELSIFPNPTNQLLTVRFNGQINGLATLSIMDIAGRKVLSGEKSISNGTAQIDVSFLSTGMYFLT
jgi:hypothetical protein